MKPNNALFVPALASILGLQALACGPSSEASLTPSASPGADTDGGGAPGLDAAPDVTVPPIEGGGCPAGYADCDHDPRNGCEAKLDDPKTCGACGHDCTGLAHVAAAAGVTCSAGACAVPASACATGFAHCSSNADDGCEADLGKPEHCGGCATSCSGATSVCSGGACGNGCGAPTPTSCSGSCVDTKTSATNCGSCGNECPLPAHGQATCASGSCAFTCDGGYHPCGSACASNSSLASCGASCTPCATPPNAVATCSGVACGFTCNAGYADCDGNAANGCEAKVDSDGNDCASCGHSCLGGACAGSVCQPVAIFAGGSPEHLVVDDANVYFSSSSNVMAITKSGTPLGTFTTYNGQHVQAIAADASYVYAADDGGGIQKLTKSAAGVALLRNASGEASMGIAAYGGALFWSVYASGWMDKSLVDGTSFAIEYSIPPLSNINPLRVAADASGVYWTETGSAANGRIMRSDLGFANPQPLLTGRSYPRDIALDASNVYWIEQGSNTIAKLGKNGLGFVPLAVLPSSPSGIAVDTGYVYFGSQSGVGRVPVVGGSWTSFAPTSSMPAQVAVDAQAVYWTMNGGVWKLAK